MKRALFLFAALMMFTASFSVKAQDVPPVGTPTMTMTVQPNVYFEFDWGFHGENGTIWIDKGDGSFITSEISNGSKWHGVVNFTTLGDTITIYGDLKNLEVINQNVGHFDVTQLTSLRYLDVEGNWIEELDLSQNANMEKLYFNYNNLTEMDLSHCHILLRLYARQNKLHKLLVSPRALNLELIYCDGNLLEACALDSLYSSLPFTTISASLVSEVNGDGSNPGNLTSNTTLATDRQWSVLKWVSSGIFEPIFGDGTGCPNLSTAENISRSFEIYPNPTSSEVNIDCNEPIQSIEILNVLGQVVEKRENLNRLSVRMSMDEHEAGLFFVRIHTSNNCYTQRLMLK